MEFLGCIIPFMFISGFIIFVCITTMIRQINEYERGVLFQFGKFRKVINPGWTIVIPVIQSMKKIDIRTKTVDLPSQETMTKDNVSISMGIVLYYSVVDVAKSILNVQYSQLATSQLSEATMRSVVGEIDLNDLLGSREKVADRIQQIIEPTTKEWGIDIESVEIKDVVLPSNMKRTMAKLAESEREKMAIIMKSEGEKLAAQNLADAAKTMSSVPGALHLRTLSTINDVSSDQSNTIIFAVPMEVLKAIEGFGNKIGV